MKCEIGALDSGLQRVRFIGRIVNLLDDSMSSKLPTAARGSLQLVIRDDTGAITVSPDFSRLGSTADCEKG